MVASQQSDTIGVLHLQAEQILKCLNWMITTINKISYKDVTCLVYISSWVNYNLPVRNSSRTSKNWPWTSPHTVTGERTGCTLDYSRKISLAFSQRCLRSFSCRHLASRRSAMHWSMFIFQIFSNDSIITHQQPSNTQSWQLNYLSRHKWNVINLRILSAR